MERRREYVSAPEGLRPLRIVVATGATAVAMSELSIQPVSAQPTDSEYAPECTYAREPHWQTDSNQDGQPGPGKDEFVCLNKPGCYDVSIVPPPVIRELNERGQLDGGDGAWSRSVILRNESLGGAVGACNGDSPLTRRDFQRVFEEHPWLTDVLENNSWVKEATARYVEDTYSVSSQNIRKLSWISIHNLDEDTDSTQAEAEPTESESNTDPEDTEIPEGVSQPEKTEDEDTDSTQAEAEPTESESNTDPEDTEIPEGVSQPEKTEDEDTDSTQAEAEPTESESNTDPEDTEIPEGVSQPEKTEDEDTDSTQAEAEPTESESNTDPEDTEIPEGVSQPEKTEDEDTDSTQAEAEPTESESNTDPEDTEIPEGVSQPEKTEDEDTDSTQAEAEPTESESNTDSEDTEIPEGVSQPEKTEDEDTDSTQAEAEPTTTSLGIMEQSPRQEVVAEVALSPIDSPADSNLPEIAIGITTAAIALGALTLFFKNRRKSTKNS